MNREQLMSVLIAPHVTEKTSLAMQNHNQYTCLLYTSPSPRDS